MKRMDERLRRLIDEVATTRRKARLALWLTWWWGAMATIALIFIVAARWTGWTVVSARSILVVVSIGGAALISAGIWRWGRDPARTAAWVEQEHPSLAGRLLTAIEMEPGPDGSWNILQDRLLEDTLAKAREVPWIRRAIERRVLADTIHMAVLLVTLALLAFVPSRSPDSLVLTPSHRWQVDPGDTELERGANLAVRVRLGLDAVQEMQLVVEETGGRRFHLPMNRGLEDQVFGVVLPSIRSNLIYRVEAGPGRSSRWYRVASFEYPVVGGVRSRLVHPGYTGQPERTFKDARRFTAIEGSRLDLHLDLNHQVQQARLVDLSREGSKLPDLELQPDPGHPSVSITGHVLTRSRRFGLILRDASGRTNRTATEFVFDVLTNRSPVFKVERPRQKALVSPLEEVQFVGEVTDDFGVLQGAVVLEAGPGAPIEVRMKPAGNDGRRQTWSVSLPLEPFMLSPGSLVSWHAWAEDIGPDGVVRRTFSELHLAVVRPLQELFRAGEQMGGAGERSRPGNDGRSEEGLAARQQKVLTATWNLRHSPASSSGKDLDVLLEAQQEILRDLNRDSGSGGSAQETLKAGSAMEAAVASLRAAKSDRPSLAKAEAREREALEALQRMAPAEHRVTRGGSRGSGGSGGSQQAQLDELEIKPSDNRYETRREAVSEPEARRRAAAQMSQLQDLLKRQQDLTSELAALQPSWQKAATEQERELAKRRLQRLRDEQQDIAESLDEMNGRSQRMNAENQQSAPDRENSLGQARDAAQSSREAMDRQDFGDALSSGRRAGSQLESLRQRWRRDSASDWKEQLKDLRQSAHELTEASRRLDSILQPDPQARASARRLTDSARSKPDAEAAARGLAEQRERFKAIEEQATELARQAESVEPLVSRQIYDAVRGLAQANKAAPSQAREGLLKAGDLNQSVSERLEEARQKGEGAFDVASDLALSGFTREAGMVGARMLDPMTRFQQGVEKASEGVLGDDTESLRRARRELDTLLDQARATTTQEGSLVSSSAASPPPSAPAGASTNQARGDSAATSTSSGQSGSTQARAPGPAAPGTPSRRSAAGAGARDGATVGGGAPWGDGFRGWNERLLEVGTLLDAPEWQDSITGVRESLRGFRSRIRQEGSAPTPAEVQKHLLSPLVEVRRQVDEAIARRQSAESLVPADRDPVPSRYAEAVKEYYERLGAGR